MKVEWTGPLSPGLRFFDRGDGWFRIWSLLIRFAP